MTNCKECGKEMSTKADKCPNCGVPGKKKTSMFTWFITILVVLWGVGYFSGEPSPGTPATRTTSAPSAKAIALGNLELDFTWTKAGFDNVMEANFIITNKGSISVKDIEIECVHFANSGTRIDSNKRTIYEIIPANGSKVFEKFNMGLIHSQAEKTNCRILDVAL